MMQFTLEIVARALFKVELAGDAGHEIGREITIANERLGQFDLG